MRPRSIYALLLSLIAVLLGVAIMETDARARSTADAAAATTARAAPAARGLPPAAPVLDDARPARRTASYAGTAEPVRPNETASIPVTVRNLGETTWESAGPAAVKLSYHLYDPKGRLVAWDGVRSALPADVAPGASVTVSMAFAAPQLTGSYTVRPDLVRDGLGWFSQNEAPAGRMTVNVAADLDATYGTTTSPTTIIPGGEVPVELALVNSGSRVWSAGGAHPVRISYHWLDGGGRAFEWDGPRSALPADVAPGEAVRLTVAVRAPYIEGDFLLVWDLVEEGLGWFSGRGVTTRVDEVTVSRDVKLYGKGWGHGIGLSQWGAQGWAQGATGTRLTGEQIVARYFPLATLDTQPATRPFRVLLSAPSTGCVGRTISNVARMRSEGGMRLVNAADPSIVYFEAAPGQSIKFGVWNRSVLVAMDLWSGRNVFVGEDTAVTLVPTQWWDPIGIVEKGLAYRGNVLVQVRDEGNLRVVNYVSSDDYMKGALPGEMPGDWEMEALRAQAITARTYAAWRQATAGDRTWDVRDDTADQCYGGHSFEGPRTTAAVASTAGKILTYDGKPIRALYSSANGGITENVGCVLDAERVGSTWRCTDGWPYLMVVADPAEALARDARGGMPYDRWVRAFTGEAIRREIITDYGVDIGGFVAMRFNESPGGRPISVRVNGTLATVELKGDRFLRNTLGLRSTLVRTTPF